MDVSASPHPKDLAWVPDRRSVPGRAADGAAWNAEGQELPLVDPAVLEDLAVGLGGPDIAQKFAQDYAGMWGQRQHRLMESVGREDRAAALDALISLKVTTAMVGGSRLAHLAGKLEPIVREGDLQEGRALLALMAIHGLHTAEELQLRYGRIHG